MSRKRKPSDETPNEIPTATIVPESADGELPTPEGQEFDKGFAEKVGKKEYPKTPDPFGIAKDNLAGVRLFESREDRQVAIKFGEGKPEDKPSQAVIELLKEAGYRWNPTHKIWTHPVRPESALATRIDAEKLYQEVRQMIREERGIEAGHDQGVPF
ncbi:MAG TPA: hypothetical protein VFE62_02875 [Gemmataceae bacterium]|nr:hypothetical protein [Gemmataceae bacterium]